MFPLVLTMDFLLLLLLLSAARLVLPPIVTMVLLLLLLLPASKLLVPLIATVALLLQIARLTMLECQLHLKVQCKSKHLTGKMDSDPPIACIENKTESHIFYFDHSQFFPLINGELQLSFEKAPAIMFLSVD
ncbi:hypothetical protein F3A81_24690 [Salmonella enterica subsp. enterica serovar Typhi]|nr:hypothetical protein [Salmonella enterica subsp. enterica serovar Typhi]